MTGSVVSPTTISDETVEAAAMALAKAACVPYYDGRDMARAAIGAAVPYIEAGLREQIASEIEQELVNDDSPTCQRCATGRDAARVARGTLEATG